jgi:hypothetical protein
MAGMRAKTEKVSAFSRVHYFGLIPVMVSKKEAKIMSKSQTKEIAGSDCIILPDVSTEEVKIPVKAPVSEIEGIKTAIIQMEAVTARLWDYVLEVQDFDKKTADNIAKMELKALNDPEYKMLLDLMPDWKTKAKQGIEGKKKGVTDTIQEFVPYVKSISELSLNLRAKYGIQPVTVSDSDKKGGSGSKSEKKAGNRVYQADIDKLSPECVTAHEIRAERESGEDYLRVFFNGSKKGTVYKSNLPGAVLEQMNA